MPLPVRRFKAGDTIEDLCRACKGERLHTVVVVDIDGAPLRVICDYCRSEHNYRGGARTDAGTGAEQHRTAPLRAARTADSPDSFALVSDRERIAPPMTHAGDASVDLEMLLRRIIREETGLTPVVPAEKWRGGTFVLRPGRPGVQERSWPIETFFHKVVMLRNRLRTLEQQLNGANLPDDLKVRLQGYITGCYGSLTSFNVLFADEDDHFKGTGEA
jgi:hypothetical protein